MATINSTQFAQHSVPEDHWDNAPDPAIPLRSQAKASLPHHGRLAFFYPLDKPLEMTKISVI